MFPGVTSSAAPKQAERLILVFETPAPNEDPLLRKQPRAISTAAEDDDPLAAAAALAAVTSGAERELEAKARAEIAAGRRALTRVLEVAGPGALSWGGDPVTLELTGLPAKVSNELCS